jgi:phage baseplate assembly protein W
MAIQLRRKEKTFIDISIGFEPNPLTKDLPLVLDQRAIETSMRNLVLTRPGEVPFDRDIGSNVYQLLFDMNDPATEELIEVEVRRTIEFSEPRVEVRNVKAEGRPEDYAFLLTIDYNIIGRDEVITVQQILRPTR